MMGDSYLNFANTKFGARLIAMLGLPQPLKLVRYQAGQAVIDGEVLLGAAEGGALQANLLTMLQGMGVSVLTHPTARLTTLASPSSVKPWDAEQGLKALVFDASGLQSSDDADQLYAFFHDAVRSLEANGRVIVLGRAPEQCDNVRQAILQRSLEGFTRSLAKELRKAITVQLIYVDAEAISEVESSLRFFLSPKSAYVSGQVVRVSRSENHLQQPNDWSAPLKDKKILVTGASQGIGLSIAEVMAREGAQVVCLDIPSTEHALKGIAKQLNGSYLLLDISADDAPQILVDAAKADGGWDVIVHNAGITRDKTIGKMPAQWWSQVVTVNLSAQELINQALLDSGALTHGGRIVCVSSISGIAGNRGQTNYALSKAGVIGMVQSQAPILANKGITINAVAPGFIETRMTAAIPLGVREAGRRLNSLSQGGLPIDVAETIAWLASPASAGVTGNTVRVCGQSMLGA